MESSVITESVDMRLVPPTSYINFLKSVNLKDRLCHYYIRFIIPSWNHIHMEPKVSSHFKDIRPSDVRMAQIVFSKRKDNVKAIDVAIGNVSLPMHPAMIRRMKDIGKKGIFDDGIIKYTETRGTEEANQAFLNAIASSGCNTEGLHCQITEGGSQAMELVVLGTCEKNCKDRDCRNSRPLMLIDPAYTNYTAMAKRSGTDTVFIQRDLKEDGYFTLPDIEEIEETIVKNRPGAIVVIPYDNPTGQFYDMETMKLLARLCVKHDIWMISDEAYRGLLYTDQEISSIWKITEKDVPGITGRRISIESSSKIWNSCGLRIGAVVTDNKEFYEKGVAESTANLSPNTIGQYIFGAIAHESHDELRRWYNKQIDYYKPLMDSFTGEMKKILPGVIVSRPDSALYSVVDVRNIVKEGFDAREFVMYCAEKGVVEIGGEKLTLLVVPMKGFYSCIKCINPGLTQMRIAFVERPEKMRLVPKLFKELLLMYEKDRK